MRQISMRLVMALVATLPGWAGSAPAAGLDEIQRRGFLTVAVAADAPPFASVDAGRPVGFDAALLDRLRPTVTFEIRTLIVPRSGLEAALRAGTADLAVGGLEITPTRQKEFLFAPPLAETTRTALRRKADAQRGGIGALSGLAYATLTDPASFLAVTELEHGLVKGGGRLGPAIETDSDAEAIDALARGRVGYLVGDLVSLARIAQAHPGVFEIGPPVAHATYESWAVATGDDALVALLGRFIVDQQHSGALATLQQSAFGRSFPDLPASVVAVDWWTERPDKPASLPIPDHHNQD